MRKIDEETRTSAPDGTPAAGQPRWRKDFPIDRSQDDFVARRDFTKFLVLTSAAFAAGQAWIVAQSVLGREGESGTGTRIATLDEIPVGGSLVFSYPTHVDPCILLRLGEESLVAYSQLCTHLSCPLIPEPVDGQLHCPCHNGYFDAATGRPTAGPPPRPLPRIVLELRGREIWATAVERRTV